MIKYCSKKFREQDGMTYFVNIHPSEMQVRMCISPSDNVFKIDVREAGEHEDTPYYGWLEPSGNITMIFPSLILLSVCFPYGIEAAEEHGDGKVIKVVISEVSKND